MNDNFIKHHRQRPDPEFVEQLYQKINSTTKRSTPMYKRPALVITLALILAAVLTLTFSPAARAAVEALLDFNGVTVTIDEETGKLVVSGNLDAVVEQTDNSVLIQGKNGMTGIAIVGQLGEMVDFGEILASTPDLVLPDIPANYTLDSRALRMPDGTLMFTWGTETGYILTYRRSAGPPPAPGQYFDGSTAAIDLANAVEIPALPLDASTQLPAESELPMARPVNEWTPTVLYEWEADGYYHSLTTDDPALTYNNLMGMVP